MNSKKSFRTLLISLREFVVEAKIYIQRSMSYISVLNSGMILFLLISKLQDHGIKLSLTQWFFPIFLVTILTMITFGFLDSKLGFFKTERKRQEQRSPHMMEIIKRLDRIERKLKDNK